MSYSLNWREFAICLIFAVSLNAFAGRRDLECRKIDNVYYVFNKSTGKQIGESGVTKKRYCQQYIKSYKNDTICTYTNEKNFQVYNASTGKVIGDGTTGSSSLKYCQNTIYTSDHGLICTYRGNNQYEVRRISDSVQVGHPSEFAGRLNWCEDYIESYRNGMFCHWAGYKNGLYQFRIYDASTNEELTSNHVFAPTDMNSCENLISDFSKVDQREVEELKNYFVSDMQPRVRALTRPVYFYTYYTLTEMGLSANTIAEYDDPALREVFEGWKNSFRAFLPDEKGWIGYGLYGAVNAGDSTEYASDNWVLMEIQVPKDKKFYDMRVRSPGIDVDINHYLHFSSTTARLIRSYCNISSNDFEGNSISKVNLTKNKTCHDALVAALDEMDVSFMVYDWYYVHQKSIRNSRGGCDNNLAPAVIFTDESLEDMPMNFYTRQMNTNYREEYQRISKLAEMKVASPAARWYGLSTRYYDLDRDLELNSQFGCLRKNREDFYR